MGNEFGNAFSTMQQTLQRGRADTRKERAYNAFRAAYGDQAGDPEAAIQLHALEQAKVNAPLNTEHLRLSNEAAQQGVDLSNTREAEQKRKTNAGGLLSGALFIHSARQRDPNADVGALFDRIAPSLELDPASASQVRQQLVDDPGAAEDLITAFRIKQGAEKGDPAAVQEYQYYVNLPDADKPKYLQLKRANATPAIAGQTAAAQAEARNASNLASAAPIAAAKAAGKVQGEIVAQDLAPSNTGKVKIAAAIDASDQSFDIADKAIDTALSDTGWLSAGPLSALPDFLNPQAANLRNELITVQSKIVLDTIQEMKNASKTGATGMGALSDREGQLIQARLGAVLQSTTPARLRKSLRDLQTQMAASRGRVKRALETELKKGQTAAAPAKGGPNADGGIDLVWNAEKGDFE